MKSKSPNHIVSTKTLIEQNDIQTILEGSPPEFLFRVDLSLEEKILALTAQAFKGELNINIEKKDFEKATIQIFRCVNLYEDSLQQDKTLPAEVLSRFQRFPVVAVDLLQKISTLVLENVKTKKRLVLSKRVYDLIKVISKFVLQLLYQDALSSNELDLLIKFCAIGEELEASCRFGTSTEIWRDYPINLIEVYVGFLDQIYSGTLFSEEKFRLLLTKFNLKLKADSINASDANKNQEMFIYYYGYKSFLALIKKDLIKFQLYRKESMELMAKFNRKDMPLLTVDGLTKIEEWAEELTLQHRYFDALILLNLAKQWQESSLSFYPIATTFLEKKNNISSKKLEIEKITLEKMSLEVKISELRESIYRDHLAVKEQLLKEYDHLFHHIEILQGSDGGVDRIQFSLIDPDADKTKEIMDLMVTRFAVRGLLTYLENGSVFVHDVLSVNPRKIIAALKEITDKLGLKKVVPAQIEVQANLANNVSAQDVSVVSVATNKEVLSLSSPPLASPVYTVKTSNIPQNDNNALSNRIRTNSISWGENYPIFDPSDLQCGVHQFTNTKLFPSGKNAYIFINPKLLSYVFEGNKPAALNLISIVTRAKVMGNSEGGKGIILESNPFTEKQTEFELNANLLKSKSKSNSTKKKNKSKAKATPKQNNNNKECNDMLSSKLLFGKIKDASNPWRFFAKQVATTVVDNKLLRLLEVDECDLEHKNKNMYFGQ